MAELYTHIPANSGKQFEDIRYGRLREALMTKEIGVAFVDVYPNAASPDHYHLRTAELYYMLSGQGEIKIDGQIHSLKLGDTVLIPPGVVHSIRADAKGLSFACLTTPPYDYDDDYEVSPNFQGLSSGSGKLITKSNVSYNDPDFGPIRELTREFGNWIVWEVQAEEGHTTPRHLHPYSQEVFIILDGNAKASVVNDEIKTVRGDVIAIPIEVELVNLENLPAEAFLPSAYEAKPDSLLAFFEPVLEADGLIFIIPEYNGSFPGVLKYYIDMLPFPRGMAGKPVTFVGLAAGEWGGMRPVEQMQQIAIYRKALVYPRSTYIRDVEDRIQGEVLDAETQSRLRDQGEGFIAFAEQLGYRR